MTQTVLFFTYSNKYVCADRIDGARRYAERAGWNIQVIERNGGDTPLDVRGIIDFWKPAGVIAECGGGIPEISRRTLGGVPCVYLDENPEKGRGCALHVNSDSARVGELAAKELLSLDCRHFAFVGWRQPRFWSEERREAFEGALRLHGRTCDALACRAGTGEMQRRRLLREWLKALPKPCGLFAVHDPAGEDVLTLAASSGISVPDELAVVVVHARLSFAPVFVTRRQSTRRFAQTDRRVARAVEFIRRRACDGIGAADVAKEMGLSRRMAEILFGKHVRRTLHEEIAAVRMERVERLLSNPRQDISSIAGLCGWSSGSALRKAFKDCHDGLSMRAWREERA